MDFNFEIHGFFAPEIMKQALIKRMKQQKHRKYGGSYLEKLTYSVDEMSKLLGISRPKAYELANRQDFPTLRIGKRILIPIDRFHRWLDESAGRESGTNPHAL